MTKEKVVSPSTAEQYVRQQWSEYNNDPDTHPEDRMSFLDWCSETGDWILKDKNYFWNMHTLRFEYMPTLKKK